MLVGEEYSVVAGLIILFLLIIAGIIFHIREKQREQTKKNNEHNQMQ